MEGEALSPNSGPGYKKHPEHRLTTKPAGIRVQVAFNGELVADSRDAIRLDEDGYPVVYYIPRRDVKMDHLVRSDHQTYCPFKGTASYYSLKKWTAERGVDLRGAVR